MQRSLRMIVADDNLDNHAMYRAALEQLGHQVLATCSTAAELIQRCRDLNPEVVLTEVTLPDLDGISAAQQIYNHCPTAIILLSQHDAASIERACCEAVSAYLIKPIDVAQLETTIAVAVHTHNRFRQAREDADALRQSLQDRKIIERAKGILMKHAQLSEEDAFRRLQKLSWDKNKKLVHIADLIITAHQALEGMNALPESGIPVHVGNGDTRSHVRHAR